MNGTTVDVVYHKDGNYGINNDLLESNISYLHVIDLCKLIYKIISVNDFKAPFILALDNYYSL